jgi:GDP/GTP exchange factor required for growth at low temperature
VRPFPYAFVACSNGEGACQQLIKKSIKTVKQVRQSYLDESLPRRSTQGKSRGGGVQSGVDSAKKHLEHTGDTSDESDLELDYLASRGVATSDKPAFQSLVFKDLPPETSALARTTVAPPLHTRLPSLVGVGGLDGLPSVLAPTLAALPVHQNALSRALTSAATRVGRWKRGLASRTQPPMTRNTGAQVSAFDLDLSFPGAGEVVQVHSGGGLLVVRRGPPSAIAVPVATSSVPRSPMPQLGTASPATQTPLAAAPTSPSSAPVVPQALAPPLPIPATSPLDTTPTATASTTTPVVSGPLPPVVTSTAQLHTEPAQLVEAELSGQASLHSVREASEEDDVSIHATPPVRERWVPQAPPLQYQAFDDAPSYRSSMASSRFSFERPPSVVSPPSGPSSPRSRRRPMSSHQSWRLDIVSIDELSDLSDDSNAPAVPPGLRKQVRRLPQRKDFEFAPRESVSSMSFDAQSSHASDSRHSAASALSDEGPTLGTKLEQWQLNAIVDSLSDNDEDGDVDAALKRLEGQLNRDVEHSKTSKVNGWVKQMRERLAAGDYSDEPSRFPVSDTESEDEDYGEARRSVTSEDTRSEGDDVSWDDERASVLSGDAENANYRDLEIPPFNDALEVITPVAGQMSHNTSTTGSQRPPAPVEDAVPLEILQSRLSIAQPPITSLHSTNHAGSPTMLSSPPVRTAYGQPSLKRPHKSFVMDLSSQVIAEHFAMIDRELFLAIKFEELLSPDSVGSRGEANTLDWAVFLKERATAKAEGRVGAKTSSLVAVRARFNLLAKFVVSEILLSHPNERARVYSKFIRIAQVSHIHHGSRLSTEDCYAEIPRYEQLQYARGHRHRLGERFR